MIDTINKLKISGIQYDILYKSQEEMGGNVGLANFNSQEIWINNTASVQTKKIAVWHELLHILSDSYNLKLNEEQVKFTTHALIAFVDDNPSAAEILMGGLTVEY